VVAARVSGVAGGRCKHKHWVESGRELRVPVAEQEAEPVGPLIEAHEQVPCLLGDPGTGRVCGDTDDVDPSAGSDAGLPWSATTTASGSGHMLDVRHLDLEEIATALQDQSAHEYRWVIDPASGEIMMWTADGGIDGKTPVDLDELDLVPIEALPSSVWHRDMAEFAERVSDERAGRRLVGAIQGKGAFSPVQERTARGVPHLLPAWHAFHHARATRRALEWLLDNSLIDDAAASSCRTEHPVPDVP
jgi:hypothetical protein